MNGPRIFVVLLSLFLLPISVGAGEYLGDKACYSCHKEIKAGFIMSRHGMMSAPSTAESDAAHCESCHGEGGEHKKAADKEDGGPMMIQAFKKIEEDKKAKDGACLRCHENGRMINWKGSSHDAARLACTDCHSVHGGRITEETCYSCHPNVKAEALRQSHIPVREGKISCSGCHNPHGSTGPSLLKTASVNETCYTCHQEKRGPFIWEHAPVRESCINCHYAHGSNNPALLTAKGALLCTSCHQYGGHVNLPRYNRASSSYGQGCINCHNRVHGSNHPSGAKFTR